MKVHSNWPDDGIILFDDECVLCSGWAQFIVRRDPDRHFRFTAIQSAYGSRLAEALGISVDDPDTNAVLLHGRVFTESDAAIAVLSALPGLAWTKGLSLCPRLLRDGIYRLVATHRYRWFGKRQSCAVPGSELAARLMG